MTKEQVIRKIREYAKSHNIECMPGIDMSCPQLIFDFDAEDAPDKRVESCIFFYKNDMEARVYYSSLGAELCKRSENISELYRLLNFINCRVMLDYTDGGRGLYQPHSLYNPRICVTEDGCFDITMTTIIPYDFFELTPIETMDYLTIHCPLLLDKLTVPIFCTLLGKRPVDEVINYIKTNLLEENID